VIVVTTLNLLEIFQVMADRRPPLLTSLTAKEERLVLNLLQQGKSNLAVVNHYSTQEIELRLEQARQLCFC